MPESNVIKLPFPMSTSILMLYLENIYNRFPIGDAPVMIDGKEIVNATVIDGRVVLSTGLEFDRG